MWVFAVRLLYLHHFFICSLRHGNHGNERYYLLLANLVTAMEYMTDNGGGEMDQAQNGEVVMGMIGPQPDPNIGTVQDAEMEEDEARSEATFRFSVPNFSKLKV